MEAEKVTVKVRYSINEENANVKRHRVGPGPEYIEREGDALFNAYFSNINEDENSPDYYPSFDAFLEAHASQRYRDYIDKVRKERAELESQYDVVHAG